MYPEHAIRPEDLLNFTELDWFYYSWEEFELTDQDLAALQILIMCNPKGGDVIAATGGLRKLRFSPGSWKTGKSHALRVCYVYFEKYGEVLLSLVYRKGDLANISDAGKRAIKAAIQRIERQFQKRFGF